MEIGREEGVLEGKLSEKIEIASSMKRRGLDRKLTMEVTGLSEKEMDILDQ